MQTSSPNFDMKPTEGKTLLTGDKRGGLAQPLDKDSSVRPSSRLLPDDAANSATTSAREPKSQPVPGTSPEESQDKAHHVPPREEGRGKRPSKPRKTPTMALFTRLSGLDPSDSTKNVSINLALPASSSKPAAPFNEAALQERFRDIDGFLRFETKLGDSQAYIGCLEADRKDVHGLLAMERTERLKYYTSSQQEDYRGRVDLFNLADIFFQCLFPSDVQLPTVAKFWGSIQGIVKVSSKQASFRSLTPFSLTRNGG